MKGLEMVKCKSLRINMLRITHTGKSVNFPVTLNPTCYQSEKDILYSYTQLKLVSLSNNFILKR